MQLKAYSDGIRAGSVSLIHLLVCSLNVSGDLSE